VKDTFPQKDKQTNTTPDGTFYTKFYGFGGIHADIGANSRFLNIV
jgi:hypothetical protein